MSNHTYSHYITFSLPNGNERRFDVCEFNRESEHVTLRTAPNGKTFYRNDECVPTVFDGFVGAALCDPENDPAYISKHMPWL